MDVLFQAQHRPRWLQPPSGTRRDEGGRMRGLSAGGVTDARSPLREPGGVKGKGGRGEGASRGRSHGCAEQRIIGEITP